MLGDNEQSKHSREPLKCRLCHRAEEDEVTRMSLKGKDIKVSRERENGTTDCNIPFLSGIHFAALLMQ